MNNKFWYVGAGHEVLAYLANIKLRDFYLDPSSCAQSFRIGRKRIREIFGEEVTLPRVSGPALSYGHIACLGAKIDFPEDSAPGVKPIYSSIEEGIRFLKKKIEFEKNSLFQHYLKVCNHLQKEFPEEKVSFSGFGWEGPITSAVLLRGQDFYIDIYDYPQKVKEFLKLLTESIIDFIHFTRKINKEPRINPEGSGLCDDFSSLISPSLWPEFVIPYWKKYYKGITTGPRRIHCENLNPGHLKYLKMVSIVHYDPSVSLKLNPRVIRKNIDIPFTWRLLSFQYSEMSKEDVRKWVYNSLKEGAARVSTIIENIMCEDDNPEKVRTFIEAGSSLSH